MKVLLWGGRSTARLVEKMLGEQGVRVSYIYDRTIDELSFATDAEFLQSRNGLHQAVVECTHFVVCIGAEHGLARHRVSKELIDRNLAPISLLSPGVDIDSTVKAGWGMLAMPGSVIQAFTKVGDAVTINSNACVDHECNIGHGVHIMGSAAVAGRVRIGNYATIGTNATILPDLNIGDGAYVGAGAVVTKDVGTNDVVAGVPASVMRSHVQKAMLEEFEDWPVIAS